MSAKPKYMVFLKFGIGCYYGEWDDQEEKMEMQEIVLCSSDSKEYVEAFFKRLSKESVERDPPAKD